MNDLIACKLGEGAYRARNVIKAFEILHQTGNTKFEFNILTCLKKQPEFLSLSFS